MEHYCTHRHTHETLTWFLFRISPLISCWSMWLCSVFMFSQRFCHSSSICVLIISKFFSLSKLALSCCSYLMISITTRTKADQNDNLQKKTEEFGIIKCCWKRNIRVRVFSALNLTISNQIPMWVEIRLNVIYLSLQVSVLLALTRCSPCRGLKGCAGLLHYSSAQQWRQVGATSSSLMCCTHDDPLPNDQNIQKIHQSHQRIVFSFSLRVSCRISIFFCNLTIRFSAFCRWCACERHLISCWASASFRVFSTSWYLRGTSHIYWDTKLVIIGPNKIVYCFGCMFPWMFLEYLIHKNIY